MNGTKNDASGRLLPGDGAKIAIIYHSADLDGRLSRDICTFLLSWRAAVFGWAAPQITTIGWDYGNAVPDVAAFSPIFMVDVCVPELMTQENRDRLVWIDHHKTAMERHGDDWFGLRIDGVAACRLCWAFLAHNGGPWPVFGEFQTRAVVEPHLVTLAGEYDVWDRRDPGADRLQYAIRSGIDFDWKTYFRRFVGGLHREADSMTEELLRLGGVIEGYAVETNKTIAQVRSHTINWEGLCFLVLNHALGNSLTFEAAVTPAHDACLMWRWDGQKCVVSLYGVPHRPELDLSELAKARGGGGHRQACGFRCSWAEMGQILGTC